jgi:hypothetical protein
MNWEREIKRVCTQLNINAHLKSENKILFICAKIPEGEQKEQLLSTLPAEFSYEFIESPKVTTITDILGICMNFGISPRVPEIDDRHFKLVNISSNPQIDEDHEIWDTINQILITDGYFESWDIEINKIKKSVNLKIAREKRGVTRDSGITEDEILNLKIALNQDISFDKFLELI